MTPVQHTIRVVNPQGTDALSLRREAAIEARALYPELHSEGTPWPGNSPTPLGGTYVIAYNADGGHREWVDAAANSIKNTLRIDAIGAAQPTA